MHFKLIQMIGPNSLCPLHLHCIILRKRKWTWPWCAELYFTCIFKNIFEIVCGLCILLGPWNEASQGMQWKPGWKLRKLRKRRTSIQYLISILGNRRNEHLDLVMLFLFCGSNNNVYEAQSSELKVRWCKSDKHWLHRTRCWLMLTAAL